MSQTPHSLHIKPGRQPHGSKKPDGIVAHGAPWEKRHLKEYRDSALVTVVMPDQLYTIAPFIVVNLAVTVRKGFTIPVFRFRVPLLIQPFSYPYMQWVWQLNHFFN